MMPEMGKVLPSAEAHGQSPPFGLTRTLMRGQGEISPNSKPGLIKVGSRVSQGPEEDLGQSCCRLEGD